MKRTWHPRAHFVGDRRGPGVLTVCGRLLVYDYPHDGLICDRCDRYLRELMHDSGHEFRPPRFTQPVSVLEFMGEQ